jgi:hypothetical protein
VTKVGPKGIDLDAPLMCSAPDPDLPDDRFGPEHYDIDLYCQLMMMQTV